MVFATRQHDFREIRRLLMDPKEQRPSADIIVSNMISSEQHLMNRQTGVDRNWTHRLLSIPTVNATSTYTLTLPNGGTFGKAISLIQDTNGTSPFVIVPVLDLSDDTDSTRYDFWVAHPPNIQEAVIFRAAGLIKIRIYPVPTGVTVLSLAYATSGLDWTSFAWSDEPILPEFRRFRQLHAALLSLPASEWEGLTRQENAAFRAELRDTLKADYDLNEALFVEYLKSKQPERNVSEVGRRKAINL